MGIVIITAVIGGLLFLGLSAYGLIAIGNLVKQKQYNDVMAELRAQVDDDVMNAFEEYEEWEKASILATNPETASEFATVVRGWRPSEDINSNSDT